MKTDRIEYSILLIYYPRLLLNVKYSTERHSVYTKTDSFRKIILNTTIKHKQTIFISGCPKPKSLHIYPPPLFFWSCIYVHESRYYYIINTEVLNFPMCMPEAIFTKRYFPAKAQILLHVSSHLLPLQVVLQQHLRVGRWKCYLVVYWLDFEEM